MTERRNPEWLTLGAALRRILDAVRPLPPERVALLDALGRAAAESVTSPVDQPPWDNSAMDGFAARAADVRGARPDAPATLRVVDDIPAGAFPSRPIGPGEAARIMTGAPVPEGADSVIRVEHTDAWGASDDGADGGAVPAPLPEHVRVFEDGDAGRNIRGRGEDLRAGDVVLDAGRVLRPAELALLAAVGRSALRVHRRPRVGILSNGDELVEPDLFDAGTQGHRIVNSNAYGLAAAVTATGGVPVLLGIAGDDRDSLREHLLAGLGLDALVTTAGASVGEHDLMKDVLEELGLVVDFWRVRIRPGSPFSFGRLPGPAPDRSVPVFGLPGNPVSALVTFEALARPALRRMAGRRDVHNPLVRVRAAERIRSKSGLVHFLRARLERDGEDLWARLTGPQGSGILRSMSDADALLLIPDGSDGLEAGDPAWAMPLAGTDAAADMTAVYDELSEESA